MVNSLKGWVSFLKKKYVYMECKIHTENFLCDDKIRKIYIHLETLLVLLVCKISIKYRKAVMDMGFSEREIKC